MNKKAKAWFGVFVHVRVCRGARVSGTAVARGSCCGRWRRRKLESAGLCWRAGEVRGELEKGAQPKERARKEEAWKML